MVSSAPETTSRGGLRDLADLRHRDPLFVLEEAEHLTAALPAEDDRRPLALWVAGLARHELGEPTRAVGHYRSAIDAAEVHADDEAAALARASLAISLLGTGAADQAQREVRRALQAAPATVHGQVELLAALVAQRTGRLDEALAAYRRALGALRDAGDDANVARLLLNRGILRAYQADAGARADLAEAEALARALDLPVLEAMAAHNLGFTEGRRGDIPAALAAFERAEASYRAQRRPSRHLATLAADRCETFLAAGLARDAGASARQALALLGPEGDLTDLTEARLLLARALLAAGDAAAAQTEARASEAAFRAARRRSWEALSAYVGMAAEVALTEDLEQPPTRDLLDRARRIARRLEASGWPVEAMHVKTFLGRLALALDLPQVVRRELGDLRPAGRGQPALLRVESWHVAALQRLADDDRAGAKRALRRGLEVVGEHRAALGATELRAGAATNGTELARLGLRMAIEDGRPWEVLRWAERWRAGAMRLRPVRPPDDPALIEDLQRLREVRSELAAAQAAGVSTRAMDTEVARLEGAVRARTMRGTRREATTQDGVAPARTLRDRLGARTLVELLAVEGRLHAVTVVRGRARLHALGSVAAVVTEADYLRAALRRLLVDPAQAARHGGTLAAAADRLDALLFRPLGLPDGPLALVPTGVLHTTAWGALPTLAHRPVTVAPSAELWGREHARPVSPKQQVGVVVGPDLPAADGEADAILSLHRGARSLRGPDADVAAVLELLEQADLVHLAAHGRFRADSPLFSSLTLADGLLTVYELERLRSVPATLVLPACDAAVVDVNAGDELLGTAAALLGLGVGAVIAPVLPVPDADTAPIMVALHHALAAGRTPSVALAEAAAGAEGPYRSAVAAAFTCIGVDQDDADVTR